MTKQIKIKTEYLTHNMLKSKQYGKIRTRTSSEHMIHSKIVPTFHFLKFD